MYTNHKKMRNILTILCVILLNNTYAQGLRIPERIFNYTLSYGPRGNSMYYSVGYEFAKDRSNANIGFGYGKIMAELNLFSPKILTMNGRPEEIYVGLNYVYTNKDYRWLVLNGGVGYSMNNDNKFMLKTSANLRVSNPFFITFSFYQTEKPFFTVGGKLFLF